jgi:hypothetical protein
MCCYISSNDNRIYTALEDGYGTVAAFTAQQRIPAIGLDVRQTVQRPRRRDKTGGRTFLGLPSSLRRRTAFGLTTYLSEWAGDQDAPPYAALVQAALGGEGLLFAGGTILSVTDSTHLEFSGPHGLGPGQAVRFQNEIRFVAAVVDDSTVVINAPFSTPPNASDELGRTITYFPATNLPSASIFDYWSPEDTIQRILAGSAVDRMRIQVNGDFHQFAFAGTARELIDSATFTAGAGGLDEFPAEPALAPSQFSLIPGSLGEVWLGAAPTQFHTLLAAEVTLDNNIDTREREFGMPKPGCFSAGERSVTVDLDILSDCKPETVALYQAAAQRTPVSMMFQLGQSEGHLCGVWMNQVVPEVPEFDDQETRLRWRFRNSRAQGTGNDELIVAFA